MTARRLSDGQIIRNQNTVLVVSVHTNVQYDVMNCIFLLIADLVYPICHDVYN